MTLVGKAEHGSHHGTLMELPTRFRRFTYGQPLAPVPPYMSGRKVSGQNERRLESAP